MQKERCLKSSLKGNNAAPLYSAQKHCGMTNGAEGGVPAPRHSGRLLSRIWARQSAFTLIELLVVVLIIGILAAVAVPQYQVTVEKARMTDSLVLLQKLKDAQERYYMANNKYATDLEELDITMPGILSSNNISLPNGLVLKLSHTDNYAYIENKKRTNALIMYYTYSPNHGQRRCSAKQGNSVANQVCKSLGGIWLLNATGCSIGDCSVYKLSD